MMSLLVGFLTFVLVVTCLFLILLILIQLPKKEAGAGVAFGGGATDALFGAGSGNALTKLTKYTATFFVIMALGLSFMNSFRAQEGNRRLEEELKKKASQPAVAGLPAPANPLSATSTQIFQSKPLAEATNQPAPSVTVTSAIPAQSTINPAPAPAATTTGAPPATVLPVSTNPPVTPPK